MDARLKPWFLELNAILRRGEQYLPGPLSRPGNSTKIPYGFHATDVKGFPPGYFLYFDTKLPLSRVKDKLLQVLSSGRCLHSSTFQLNLSRFWHKIHPEHLLIPPDTSSTLPKQPLNAPPITQKALTLSRKVDEFKPLSSGRFLRPSSTESMKMIMVTWNAEVEVFGRVEVTFARDFSGAIQASTKVGRCRLTLSNPR
jgi:hypothetical protein